MNGAAADEPPGRGRAGPRVAVTRAAGQSEGLIAALEARGATAVELPLLRIAGPEEPGPLHAAARRLEAYDWLVFTSANGVRGLMAVLGGAVVPPGVRIACVGPATARALEDFGRAADLLPERHDARALAAALAARADGSARVLWPRGDRAQESLAEDLRAAGLRVDAPIAYRTIAGEGAAELAGMLRRGEVDVVTLTSPSAAQALAAALGSEPVAARFAVIGPVTAAAARAAGLPVDSEPADATAEALADAVIAAAARRDAS